MQDTAGEVRTNPWAIYICGHWRAKLGRLARTYIQQLCTDAGYSLEDLSGAMDDMDGGGVREGQGNLCEQHDVMRMIITRSQND